MIQFDIQTFGALPDGRSYATEAIRSAVRACVERGGGTVYVPPGEYLCTPFELASNVTLYLEAGAVLLGSGKLEDYPLEEEKLSQESLRAGLVTAHHAQNVSIAGRGIIDGNAMAFLLPDKLHAMRAEDRPYTRQGLQFNADEKVVHGPLAHNERPGNLVRFHNCQNVEFSGVTVRNAPTWTVHFKDCLDVRVHGVRINSPASDRRTPNDDGIDLEACAYVRISDCEIDTGDDCIAVFGSHTVTVSNCTLRSRSAGVRVNYDTGHAHDLAFNNLVIEANRGIVMMVRGEALTENILFSNLIIRTHLVTGNWWGAAEPISISAIPGTSSPMPPGQAHFNQNRSTFSGQIRNVRFTNILAEGEHGIVLWGSENSRIAHVHFDNVRLSMRSSPYHANQGGNFDLRPAAEAGLNLFAHDIPAVFARCVEDLSFHGLQVEWEDGLPQYFTHALQVEYFAGLSIAGFEGRQAHENSSQAVISLANGREVSIVHSRAAEGTGTFLSLEKVEEARLFHGNDLTHARQAVIPAQHTFQNE